MNDPRFAFYGGKSVDDAEKKVAGDDGSKQSHKFGWEEPQFGGAFKAKPVRRQLSTKPNDFEIFKEMARSHRLVEAMSDAGETEKAMASRVEVYELGPIKEINVNKCIEMATHRTCGEFWKAYTMCREVEQKRKTPVEKQHEICSGWYETYGHCLDKNSTTVMLNVLQAMTANDPSANVQKLRD